MLPIIQKRNDAAARASSKRLAVCAYESVRFLKFIQSQPQEKKFAVDFFQGDKSDVDEYLAMYEAGGWEYISSYKTVTTIFRLL